MKYFSSLSVVIAYLMLQSCSSKNETQLLDIGNLIKSPRDFTVKISPEGKNIIIVKDFSTVLIQSLSDSVKKELFKFDDAKISELYWKNEKMLVFLTEAADSIFKLYKYSIETNEIKIIYENNKKFVKILNELGSIENELILGLKDKDSTNFDVYRFFIAEQKCEIIGKNNGKIVEWLPDIKGKIRVAVTRSGAKAKILYRENENSDFAVISENSFDQINQPICFTEDSQNLLLLSNCETDKAALYEYNPIKKSKVSLIYRNANTDIENVLINRNGVLIAVQYYSWRNEFEFFEANNQEKFRNIQRRLKNYDIQILDFDTNFENIILKVFNEKTYGFIYSYKKGNDELKKIYDLSPWINEQEMAETKPIDLRTKDSLLINGYLTFPKNQKLEKLSVIIKLSSNIWKREMLDFDGEAQFFASRGYAVLRINTRGKYGFGNKFLRAGFKQLSGGICQDIKTSADWLIEQGIANKGTISVYGEFMSGLIALNSTILYPEYFSSCISVNSIVNLKTLYNKVLVKDKSKRVVLYKMIADSIKDDLEIKTNSPFYNYMKIKTPIFFVHGAKNKYTDIREIKQMIKGLEFINTKVDYLIKDDEAYPFKINANRIEAYEQIIQFLNKLAVNKITIGM